MLELNDVLLDGAEKTVSMMAHEGEVTCIRGGSQELRSRLLLSMLGLEPVKSGFISIDGEPLERRNVQKLRKMMSYVPSELRAVGEVKVTPPPSVQDVFNLKDNRDASISNGILSEEMKRTGASKDKAQLLAVAVLRQRPILLVDTPEPVSMDYLRQLAAKGRLVIVCSDDEEVMEKAHQTIEV